MCRGDFVLGHPCREAVFAGVLLLPGHGRILAPAIYSRPMELGIVGLGKMGANMARRLVKAGHRIVAHDRNEAAMSAVEEQGAQITGGLSALVAALQAPRAVWVMVPAGDPTERTIQTLSEHLAPGDVIIDGGNSFYKESIRRAGALKGADIHFLDVGTSGGIWGVNEGYSLMIGGEAAVCERLAPIFQSLAPAPNLGWGRVGPHGAGHFVKMIHNGIEYGLMQAYAEGFELIKRKTEMDFDVHQIAEIWRHGSVVRSWLLDLTARALRENPALEGIAAYVPDSGEGRWTVAEAIDLGVSIPVISLALQRRFRSREAEPFSDKLLAALRDQFGGHGTRKAGGDS
jgi:6-phosphogluconate dehydrogenase